MLLLILAFQSFTQAPEPAASPGFRMVTNKVSRDRNSSARKARVVRIAPQRSLKVADVRPDPNQRYRLESESYLGVDGKSMAARGVWRECGVSGMPVCPGRARPVLRASLGD